LKSLNQQAVEMPGKSADNLLKRQAVALSLGLVACLLLLTGCETKTTSKGFSSGFNYKKPGRESKMVFDQPKPQAMDDEPTNRGYNPGPDVPAPIAAVGKALGDMFALITPPPPGMSEKEQVQRGFIPQNYTGPYEMKDKEGNTIKVQFDRGRIIKKEVIPADGSAPLPTGPMVIRSDATRR
jgi:hypothetical protein